jgi:hypothetical protein
MRLVILLSFFMCLALITCKKEKETVNAYAPDCTGDPKSFAKDVSPVISSSCAKAGCHASGSANGPGALTSHAQISAAKTAIRSAVIEGRMPKDKTLTEGEKNSIICWIDAGAENN